MIVLPELLWPDVSILDSILHSIFVKNPNLWSFMSPLSFEVWICIMTAYLAVSLILYIISRWLVCPSIFKYNYLICVFALKVSADLQMRTHHDNLVYI